MRIHKLELENIASLKGHHQIEFDKIASESSLFAITGKTGAGKSSILNSISLALYGDVYKRDAQNLDFVTLGEASGYIKLTFSIQTIFYEAYWEMKLKKKNGEYYKKPQLIRTLSKQTPEGLIAVEEQIEEIINLNFSQFCKTSILNQGEFAKFLTSSFTERKSILEKFYDGMNLELINQKLKEKLKENKELIENKSHQVQGIQQTIEDIDVDEDKLKQKKKLSDQLGHVKESCEKIRSEFKDLYQNYEMIISNRVRLKDLIEKKDNAQKEYNILKKKNDELENLLQKATKKLKERKPVLDTCIEKQITFDKNIEYKNKLQDQKNSYLKEKEQAQKNLELFTSEIEKKENKLLYIEEQTPHLLRIDPDEVFKDKTSYFSLNEKLKTTQNLLENVTQKINSFNKKKETTQKEISYLETNLQKFKTSDFESNLKLMQNKRDELNKLKQNLSNHLNDYNNLLQANDKYKEDIAFNQQKIKNFDQEISNLNKDLLPLESIQKLYKLEQAASLCHEESLKDGTCVVCGSTINSELREKSINNEDFNETLVKSNLIHDKISTVEKNKNEVNISFISLQNSLQQNKDKMGSLSAMALMEWNKHSDLPLSQTVLKAQSLDIINKHIEKFEKSIHEIQSIIDQHKSNLQHFENFSMQAQEISAQIDQYTIEKQNFENEVGITKNSKENLSKKYFQEVSDFEKEFEELYKNTTEIKKTITDLENDKKERLGLTQIQIGHDAKIKALNVDINNLVEKNNYIQEYLSKNTTKNLSPKEELKKLQIEQEERQNALRSNEERMNKEHIFLAESKSKQESFEEQINAATLQIQKYQQHLFDFMNQQTKAYFINLESFDKIPSLVQKIIDFTVTENDDSQVLNITMNQFLQLDSRAKELFSDVNKEKIKMQTLFDKKQDAQKQIDKLSKQVEKELTERKKLDNLNDLVGKDEFRNYILSIIETTLIEQTNKELNTLCNGRYSLVQSNKTNRLITEFKIIDHFSDGMVRKLSTLSGGETFQVSLAMAIALAELTRGQTQLDSLFIDEGFGTLDSETIDEVYELLLSIQHTGKQIGIISHVKDLTNRIPINVNLEKSSTGTSKIQIIHN